MEIHIKYLGLSISECECLGCLSQHDSKGNQMSDV